MLLCSSPLERAAASWLIVLGSRAVDSRYFQSGSKSYEFLRCLRMTSFYSYLVAYILLCCSRSISILQQVSLIAAAADIDLIANSVDDEDIGRDCNKNVAY